MRSDATTPEAYLASLPDDRRAAIAAVRKTIVDNLPAGYVERISYGMIAYEVPLSVYPDTYNKQPTMYAALASQKSHMAVYLMNVYGVPALLAKLQAGFKQAGKRLDMGKSCVRFQKLEDLPLPVIAEAIAATPMDKYVAFAKAAHANTKTGRKKAAAQERAAAKSARNAAAKPAKKVAAKPAKKVTASPAKKVAAKKK